MAFEEYNPTAIEIKWQKVWKDQRIFSAPTPSSDKENRPKYYCLSMFPYPSGQLHMGHIRNYSIGDVVTRYKRMCGFNVLQPIGWDAFGMPAENAAIERGIHPKDWTLKNISQMKKELERMGFLYDWEREITTCLPEYYKWEQLFFLNLYKEGLAYKKRGLVNWCESCQTVLANEQVHNGKCWRCSSNVIEKNMDQWYVRITDYAEALLDGHKSLTDLWPERVIEMQKHWIGKSEGCFVHFQVKNSEDILLIFTTRVDTIYGVTFLVIAPSHPLAEKLCTNNMTKKELNNLKSSIKKENELSKRGFFTGSYSIHPLTGEEIPIWVGEFVVMEYGSGVVMGVPAHDERDFEFAITHNLPIKIVITKDGLIVEKLKNSFTEFGILTNSAEFNGLSSEEAIQKISEHLEERDIGKRAIQYRLKDWGISRQRYWGAPIPIIYCNKCGIVPVPEKDLPVTLPYDVVFKDVKGNPLASHSTWGFTLCPKCGEPSRRETDTMDTFIESSWYYARYTSSRFDKGPFDVEIAKEWLPVDCYIGGIEHACMHLLYARFFHKVLKKWGYFSDDEPFLRLITQGMVIKDGAKMSKSLGNIVSPTEMVTRYGADTVRLFCLFAAPIEKDLEWNEKGVEGCFRFVNRIWRLVLQFQKELSSNFDKETLNNIENQRLKKIRSKTHWMINKVTADMEQYKFNTAISACMELVNEIYLLISEDNNIFSTDAGKAVLREALEALTLSLAPFCPHLSDEIWEKLGFKNLTINERWPQCDPNLLGDQFFLLVVQINGKVRDKILMDKNFSEEKIKKLALSSPKVQKWVTQKEIKKLIYIKERLINVVI